MDGASRPAAPERVVSSKVTWAGVEVRVQSRERCTFTPTRQVEVVSHEVYSATSGILHLAIGGTVILSGVPLLALAGTDALPALLSLAVVGLTEVAIGLFQLASDGERRDVVERTETRMLDPQTRPCGAWVTPALVEIGTPWGERLRGRGPAASFPIDWHQRSPDEAKGPWKWFDGGETHAWRLDGDATRAFAAAVAKHQSKLAITKATLTPDADRHREGEVSTLSFVVENRGGDARELTARYALDFSRQIRVPGDTALARGQATTFTTRFKWSSGHAGPHKVRVFVEEGRRASVGREIPVEVAPGLVMILALTCRLDASRTVWEDGRNVAVVANAKSLRGSCEIANVGDRAAFDVTLTSDAARVSAKPVPSIAPNTAVTIDVKLEPNDPAPRGVLEIRASTPDGASARRTLGYRVP